MWFLKGWAPTRVVFRHTQTPPSGRRDFRWVRLADNSTSPCDPPGVPLKPMEGGGNCLQPMLWHAQELQPQPGAPRVYQAAAPTPTQGWAGYYVELFFDAALPGTRFQVLCVL